MSELYYATGTWWDTVVLYSMIAAVVVAFIAAARWRA